MVRRRESASADLAPVATGEHLPTGTVEDECITRIRAQARAQSAATRAVRRLRDEDMRERHTGGVGPLIEALRVAASALARRAVQLVVARERVVRQPLAPLHRRHARARREYR